MRRRVDNPALCEMASTAFHSCRQSLMVLCFLLATIVGTPATSVSFLIFFISLVFFGLLKLSPL
jgi:hypothetical protein